MMETTPLLVKKNDDNNTIKGKIFSRSAKYILLSCVFVLLATFAVTTTTSSSSSSPSSERMMVRMKGYASRAAAPLFLRGRSTTTSSLDAAKLGEEVGLNSRVWRPLPRKWLASTRAWLKLKSSNLLQILEQNLAARRKSRL